MNNAKILQIDDNEAVAALGEKFAKAFEFLRRADIARLSPGRTRWPISMSSLRRERIT